MNLPSVVGLYRPLPLPVDLLANQVNYQSMVNQRYHWFFDISDPYWGLGSCIDFLWSSSNRTSPTELSNVSFGDPLVTVMQKTLQLTSGLDSSASTFTSSSKLRFWEASNANIS